MTHSRNKGRFFLLFLLIFFTGCSLSPGGELIEQTDAEYAGIKISDVSDVSDKSNVSDKSDLSADINHSEDELIWVHICGQVKNPGVYSFPEGSRVFDAVEAAGGFTETADRDSVNLALTLSDEGKIYILSKEEQKNETNQDQSQTDQKINVNRATLNELMTLPGIGQKRAESILKLRDKKGSFQTIEELLEAEGIKEGIFEQIKDFIKV